MNLYTYCNSNPINYWDPSGNNAMPWNDLPFFGYIHVQVQMYLISIFFADPDYLMQMEKIVRNENGKIIGRADLYSSVQRQVWEVKPWGAQLQGLSQLEFYNKWLNTTSGGMLPGGVPSADGLWTIFQFSDGIFDITFYSGANGLIMYGFEPRKQDSTVPITEKAKSYASEHIKKYATATELAILDALNPSPASSPSFSIPGPAFPNPLTGDPIIDFIRDIFRFIFGE